MPSMEEIDASACAYMGATGWWLGENDAHIPESNERRFAYPMVDPTVIYRSHQFVGFTYSPTTVLAWLKNGTLPKASP